MRITYIHQHFKLPSERGGSRPYEFARRMASEGHEVTMVCGGVEPYVGTIDGINIQKIGVPYGNEMSTKERVRSFLKFSIGASRLVAKTKTDLIFASSTPLTVAIPALFGKIVHRRPMVFEVRDLWPSVPIELGYLNNPFAIRAAQFLEKIAYKYADRVVALSPGMKEGVLEVCPNKSVLTIPNACDFSLFELAKSADTNHRIQNGWQDSEIVIIYAGGFGPTYDLEWVVRVAAQLKDEDIRFVLIGQGKTSHKLKELAEELGLDPDTMFLGSKPRSEVVELIQAADIVLSSLDLAPCLEVNSLNKVFDGMAAGKPIILNHNGWLKEMVVNSGAGWKIERPLDVATEQIRTIAKDPRALEEAAAKSSQIGKDEFNREKLYRKLMDLLEDAIK